MSEKITEEELARTEKRWNAGHPSCSQHDMRRVISEVRRQSKEIKRLRRGLEMITRMPTSEATDDFQRGLSHAAGVAMGILSKGTND